MALAPQAVRQGCCRASLLCVVAQRTAASRLLSTIPRGRLRSSSVKDNYQDLMHPAVTVSVNVFRAGAMPKRGTSQPSSGDRRQTDGRPCRRFFARQHTINWRDNIPGEPLVAPAPQAVVRSLREHNHLEAAAESAKLDLRRRPRDRLALVWNKMGRPLVDHSPENC